MNRELLEALVRCSAELQAAHKAAMEANRTDIAAMLRSAAIDVADAIALTVPDRSKESRAS